MPDAPIQHIRQRIQWPPQGSSFEPITNYQSIAEIASDIVVWTPSSGRRIILAGMILGGEADNNISLKGLSRGKVTVIPLVGIDKFDHAGGQPIWVGERDEKLVIDTSTDAQSFITLYGHEDS